PYFCYRSTQPDTTRVPGSCGGILYCLLDTAGGTPDCATCRKGLADLFSCPDRLPVYVEHGQYRTALTGHDAGYSGGRWRGGGLSGAPAFSRPPDTAFLVDGAAGLPGCHYRLLYHPVGWKTRLACGYWQYAGYGAHYLCIWRDRPVSWLPVFLAAARHRLIHRRRRGHGRATGGRRTGIGGVALGNHARRLAASVGAYYSGLRCDRLCDGDGRVRHCFYAGQ